MDEKQNIRLLAQSELIDQMKSLGQPKFRANQVYEWIWDKGIGSFELMSNTPKTLRKELEDQYFIPIIQLDKRQISTDGTIKDRYALHDGAKIESVLIPVQEQGRFTVCVSSQVGCSLSCSFCATGQLKRMRNLNPGEIVDQVRLVNEECLRIYGQNLTNIVFMGMGEPLLNYNNVMEAINKIHKHLGFSMKRITVSTVGIVKMIRKLVDDKVKFNLALSLHAADDEKRSEIMPINDSNNLAALRKALIYFFEQTKNKITLEYIAFNKFNDHIDDAENLASFCKGFPVTVNIIEYNPISTFNGIKSQTDRLDRFASYLRAKRISVTVRKSRGKDIDAACGQLANQE